MTHIVTAKKLELHVSSGDDGALNAALFGPDLYVLSGCGASVVNSNKVTVSGGEILMHGRHIRVDASGESVTIENGAQSKKRNDLLGILYKRDTANQDVEDAPLHVLKGTPVPDIPADPAYNASASILKGDAEVFRPLYRIPIDGLSVGAPVPLYKTLDSLSEAFELIGDHKHSASDIASGTLPLLRGGTGVTTDAAIALKAWPVGSVYSSYDPTSPAARFGGTWTAITGVFPYFNAGTATGGANMHTLTTAQLPKSKVYSSVWINGSAGLDDALYTGAFSQGSEYVYIKETYIGNGQSHNNMPAYQTLYAWRRTA